MKSVNVQEASAHAHPFVAPAGVLVLVADCIVCDL